MEECAICGKSIERGVSLNGKQVCNGRDCINKALNPTLGSCSGCGAICTGFAAIVGDKQFCATCSAAQSHVPYLTEAQKAFHRSRTNP